MKVAGLTARWTSITVSPAKAGAQTDPDDNRDPARIGSARRDGFLLATGLRRYGSGPRPSPGNTAVTVGAAHRAVAGSALILREQRSRRNVSLPDAWSQK